MVVGQVDFVQPRTKSGFAHRAKSGWTERKQKYTNPRPAAATAALLICFPFGFLTVLIDIILVLTPDTVKCSVGSATQEHLLTVLAQAHRLILVHQHEAE